MQLDVTGGLGYTWTPATGLSDPNIDNPVASPVSTTTYSVTSTVGFCTDTDSITINIVPAPIATAGADEEICIGESVQLDGGGGLTYSWSPPATLDDATSEDPLSTPASTTVYTVTVTDVTGCSASDDVTVTVNPLPTILAGPDTLVCEGENIQMNASGLSLIHI